MFKKHWKTPYRESPYNIQKKERRKSLMDQTEAFVAEKPELNPNDYVQSVILYDQIPDYKDAKLLFDQDNLTEEEQR